MPLSKPTLLRASVALPPGALPFGALPVFPPLEVREARALREGLYRMYALQPDLQTLRDRLVALGGWELVPPALVDPELDLVLTRGVSCPGFGARRRRGLESDCHSNVARLREKSGGALRVVTGYALSADGLWRQHSWGLDPDGTPVETTVERVLYHGVVLGSREARRFVASYR